MRILMFATLALTSCGEKVADSGAESSDCGRKPPLTWDNFGEGMMDKHCNGCHSTLVPRDQRKGAPVGVDFNTYEGVLEFADRIHARSVVEPPTMPPGGGPDPTEKVRLEEWLRCEVAKDRAAREGAR